MANGLRPEPRYVGWVADDREFLTQLKYNGAALIYGTRAVIDNGSRPMRVTVIVHRPRIKRRSKGK